MPLSSTGDPLNTTREPLSSTGKPLNTAGEPLNTGGEQWSQLRKLRCNKVKLISAIVRKDLCQTPRHGLRLMIGLSIVLLLLGMFLFSSARTEFEKRGTPDWTGEFILSDPNETKELHVEISAEVLTGEAPFNISLTSAVTGGRAPYSFSWDLGDGNVSELENVSHVYLLPRDYEIVLTVEDSSANASGGDGGGSGEDGDGNGNENENGNGKENEKAESQPLRILVTEAGGGGGEVLRASISSNITQGSAPARIRFFSAVVGGVVGNGTYTYSWDFGEGNTSNLADPEFSYVKNGEYTVVLTVEDDSGNASISNTINITLEKDEEGGVPFNLLEVTFGFAVLVTMFLLPVAFSGGYNHEVKKGTIRTLVTYPVGVLGITLSKLIYTGIAGLLITGFVFYLPVQQVEKSPEDVAFIFLSAYFLTLMLIALGACAANALALFARRMYIRPPTLPYLLVILSFLFTRTIVKGIATFLEMLGMDIDPDSVVQGFEPIISLSPYHNGGAFLSQHFDGPGSYNEIVVYAYVILILLGVLISSRVFPNVYEKE